jgi:hypothetical protein
VQPGGVVAATSANAKEIRSRKRAIPKFMKDAPVSEKLYRTTLWLRARRKAPIEDSES